MTVTETLKARHSTRAFKKAEVPNDLIIKIMEAANCSPTWANTQPWEIFIAKGDALERIRDKYAVNYDNDVPRNPDIPGPTSWPEAHGKRTLDWGAKRLKCQWGIDPAKDVEELKVLQKRNAKYNGRFFDAPCVIFLAMDKGLSSWSLFDMGIISQSIMLAAQENGLNTGVAFHFSCYPDILRAELNVPENLNILLGIAIGYGDPESIENKYIAEHRSIDEYVRIIDK